jgi:hypothetical protein
MDLDIYSNTIRQLIIQENDLENKRINWLIIFNGILLSGFIQLKDDLLFDIILAFIGIIISLSFWWSFFQGNRAIDFLITKWNEKLLYHNKNFDEFPPIAGIPCYNRGHPKYSSQKKITAFGKFIAPSKILSPIFILVWITIIIYYLN